MERANRSFYSTFNTRPENAEGKKLYDLGDGDWDIPRLRRMLEKIISQHGSFDDFPVERDFPGMGRRKMMLNARRVQRGERDGDRILLAIEDVTDRSRGVEASPDGE